MTAPDPVVQRLSGPVPGQLAINDGPRIGSLCSGYGGLDMAVADVLGGGVVWHCQYDPDDRKQAAARILAHHWPKVPNYGDITATDWQAVEPVDVLTAGFPCQDVSLAGLRAGIAPGTRSGLWAHVARAISVLRPRLVVIENVPGLLSSPAARGVGPDGTSLDEDGGSASTLRAVGAVLGDLADLRFDAEWVVIPASAVLGPHQRRRVFILAWPAADTDDERVERAGGPGRETERHTSGSHRAAPDTPCEGQLREGVRRRTTGGRVPAPADADGSGRGQRPGVISRLGTAEQGTPVEDADLATCGERRKPAPGQEEAGRARSHPRGRGRAPATDAQGERRHEGGPGAEVRGRDADTSEHGGIDWGPYAYAVARWEAATGHPAPRPTDDRGRLAPKFVEWMMGLPPGHVTAVPGLSRPAQLKALGNGVMPQQAAYALRFLLHRARLAERIGQAP